MWSRWPWVVSTSPTLSSSQSGRRTSGSSAASISTDAPVSTQRTTYTLFTIGPDHHLGDLDLVVFVVDRHGREYAPVEQLRSRVRAFLADVSPPAEVRRLMEDERGYDLDVWLRLAADHDLLALESWPERAVVLEEAGRVLLCAPYLATVTAAPFLPEDVREAVAGGLCIATLAIAEATGRWDAGGVTTRAVQSPDGRWRLEGEKSYVVDGCAADVLVVAARPDGAGDVALFQVDGDAAGVDREPLATVDLDPPPGPGAAGGGAGPAPGRVAGRRRRPVRGGPGRRAGRGGRAGPGDGGRARRPAGPVRAADRQLPGREAPLCRDAAGAGVGAGGGRCMRVSVVDTDDLPEAAAVAKVCCSEAYVRIATDSLHVHGGLGFTWDHDAHLYFRRARSSLHLFGDPRYHRERLARHLGL